MDSIRTHYQICCKPVHRYDRDLLETAKSLHEQISGSATEISYFAILDLYGFLFARSNDWTYRDSKFQVYDEAVRELVLVVMSEMIESGLLKAAMDYCGYSRTSEFIQFCENK
jgi:hypothetical protein